MEINNKIYMIKSPYDVYNYIEKFIQEVLRKIFLINEEGSIEGTVASILISIS